MNVHECSKQLCGWGSGICIFLSFYSYLSKLQIKILSQVLDMVSVIACKVAIHGIIPGLQWICNQLQPAATTWEQFCFCLAMCLRNLVNLQVIIWIINGWFTDRLNSEKLIERILEFWTDWNWLSWLHTFIHDSFCINRTVCGRILYI